MKKSKKSSDEPRDRLSELPDSIIFEIFWLLRMRDVVRTTVLSKRWKNLWTTTPYLNFDFYRYIDSFNGYQYVYHASEFVNRALILWRGFKILKFKFSRGSIHNKSVFNDIDSWVRLATENGIEELYLADRYPLIDEVYIVPHNLYSCSSLKVLSLEGCSFQNHGNVKWNQLKSLTIKGPLIDQDLIDKVISGSPQLEVFILNLWEHDENLSIRSSSLKMLSIHRQFNDEYYEPSMVTELRIWSPNLETLDIVGISYGRYSLMNVSSLTHLTLDFCFPGYFTGEDFVGEILGKIFPAIQHVEKLTICEFCIKGLIVRGVKEKYLLSPLSNFKFLTISACVDEYEEILDLLQIFPKLEAFVLQSEYYLFRLGRYEYDTDRFLRVEKNLSKSFLLQLRTVELTCFEDECSIFPFIEILLKRACNLQKMIVRLIIIKGRTPDMCLCLTLKKLLRMPRSSPTAELIVTEAEH